MTRKTYLLLIVTAHLTFAQSNCPKAVLRTSSDYKAQKFDKLEVKKMHRALWSDSLIIKTDKGVKTYGPDAIWGYRDADCAIYRNFQDDFYKVEQHDSLVIYTQTFYPNFWDFPNVFYFFSRSLDSPIYKLTRKNLENEFKDCHCLLEKISKELKWYEDYSAVDRKKHIFKIIEAYKECGCK